MKFWLDIPCSELSREWLLDEHRSIHAYINGMLKNPDKWCAHKLFGPMDPEVLFIRHEEEVREMIYRGYNHGSPVSEASVNTIMGNMRRLKVSAYGTYIKKGIIVTDNVLSALQENYMKIMHYEKSL